MGHVNYVQPKISAKDASECLRESFDQIIRQFCTMGFHAPPGGSGATRFDEDLYNHIKNIREVFDTDAEAVAVNNGMDMAGALLSHAGRRAAYFPNNKILVKDPTHAARRVLERP
eukprot:1409521-Pyramimonas_sp.AAC.1